MVLCQLPYHHNPHNLSHPVFGNCFLIGILSRTISNHKPRSCQRFSEILRNTWTWLAVSGDPGVPRSPVCHRMTRASWLTSGARPVSPSLGSEFLKIRVRVIIGNYQHQCTLIKNVPALGNIFDQSYNLHLSVWLRSEAWVGHGPWLLMISPGIFSIFRRI